MSKEGGLQNTKDKKKRLPCPKCAKTLSSKDKLKYHCLVLHQWSLEDNAPAAPEAVAKGKEKRKKYSEQRHLATRGVQGEATATGMTDDPLVVESSVSSMGLSDSGSDGSDMEPEDAHWWRDGGTPTTPSVC